ncbi:hypothetical protein DFH08DRAFT_805900 [Mycena albidolilacea]|uniref:Uncharacterized protein n=1 Tax=Mycena albidolilacea TaxID=1033008 RepID=A0AAD7A847_9AGAR|nr:hypothetical protein DFH08DRAFT_805900 [Mycena albidolilacea]
MRFNILLLSIIFNAVLIAGMTLPEVVETEKRQCLATNANCFITNPGVCCSGGCCCGFDSFFGCTDTPCSLQQEEGLVPGAKLNAHVYGIRGRERVLPFQTWSEKAYPS